MEREVAKPLGLSSLGLDATTGTLDDVICSNSAFVRPTMKILRIEAYDTRSVARPTQGPRSLRAGKIARSARGLQNVLDRGCLAIRHVGF
jgi:hypothetical protein